jgi:5-methylcytosine-specific restriction endonuclease McrA
MTSLALLPSVVAEAPADWLAEAANPPLLPASLEEARALRDDLAALLARDRAATADFLLALAGFDRRRGWEALGHGSCFAFLTRALRLSNGAAHLRLSAARLLPRFPEVEAALRDGRLCISAAGELARVLTPQNRADVLPRFFGRSSREAREVAAALAPRADPPRREVVTAITVRPPRASLAAPAAPAQPAAAGAPVASPACAPTPAAPSLRAHEVAAPPRPLRAVEPLDADLRRLHPTVSRRLLDKVAAAKVALSHARPCATTEEVLEAALDLLLERRARAKALVKRPRASRPAPPDAPPRAIPAAVEREVRLRDAHRCQWPVDGGGVCGATWRVELDHVVPVAQGGPSTASNLRLLCEPHNGLAARLALGGPAAAARPRPASPPRSDRRPGPAAPSA